MATKAVATMVNTTVNELGMYLRFDLSVVGSLARQEIEYGPIAIGTTMNSIFNELVASVKADATRFFGVTFAQSDTVQIWYDNDRVG